MRLLTLWLALSLAAGHAAHITDKLVVGLYPEPKAEGTPLQLLSSGTPLEVLSQQGGFAEVRLADDQTGWVEAGYVTEEKPAKAMLLETQARLRQMGMELASLRERASGADPSGQAADGETSQRLAEAQQRIVELEAALARQQADGAARQRLEQVNAQVRQAVQTLAATQGWDVQAAVGAGRPSIIERYRSWLIGLTTATLGFLAGVLFIDYRIRRRYGGFRLR
jgi:SH3 domain protein